MYNQIKPSIFTGNQYGQKVTVEIDHSDIDFHEAFQAFKTIAIGLGWSDDIWKSTIMEFAEQYQSEIVEQNTRDEDNDWSDCNQSIKNIIFNLNQIEVDGETTQYILEKIGMDEQLAIQLATKYPDMVLEHLSEIKSEKLNNK